MKGFAPVNGYPSPSLISMALGFHLNPISAEEQGESVNEASNLDQAKRVQLVCKAQAMQWCFCRFGIIKHWLWKQELALVPLGWTGETV